MRDMRDDPQNPYGIMAAVAVFFASVHICAGAVSDVRAHGATGDGVAIDTPAIQKVVDAADGGGAAPSEVEYLKAKWRSRPADRSTGMDSAQLMESLPPLVEEWKKSHSWRVAKAMAFEYLCSRSAIDVTGQDWFPAFADWTFAPQTGSHSRTRYRGHPMWALIQARRKEVLAGMDPAYEALRKRGAGRWTTYHDFDHSAPDWEEITKLGFPGMERRLEANGRDTDYYIACGIASRGVMALLGRFAALCDRRLSEARGSAVDARVRRLEMQRESIARLLAGPPQTAFDVLSFIYLFWAMSEQFEAVQVRTLGNLDKIVAPYYFADVAAGRTTEREFREQLEHFWWQWGSIDNYYGQPVYFGGTKADGSTEYNDVSRIMLDVHDALALPTPKLHIKIGASTPDWLWRKSLEMMRRQRSISFIGEEPHARVIRSMGYSAEQAREFMVWGCYEWAVKDSANDIFGAAVNMVKPIEEMLSDAKEGRLKATDFGEFKSEFVRRLNSAVDEARRCVVVGERCRGEINPSLLFSLATEYSVKTGKDAIIDGTANGNNTGIWMVGLGTAVDALMGVDEIVFRRRDMDLPALGGLMSANWGGREDLRLRMCRSKRKWGNNDAMANAVAAEIVEKVFAPVDGLDNGRGGRFKVSGHVAKWFIRMGRSTAATPDGRRRGDELSKNVSPSMGSDTEGPTALLESVRSLDATHITGDLPLDVALLPGTVAGEKGLALMRTLIERYFANGGLVIQFNIADPGTLRDAQRHPEKYANLQVRVCGWNVRWNDLPKAEQDAYIRRAANIAQ